jgi:hypothetical protein
LQITGGETFTRATKKLHALSDWDQSSSRWRYAIVAGQMAHIPVLQNTVSRPSLSLGEHCHLFRALHLCTLAGSPGPDSGDPLKTPAVSQGFRTLTRGRLEHLLFFSLSFPFFFSFCRFLFHFSFFLLGISRYVPPTWPHY